MVRIGRLQRLVLGAGFVLALVVLIGCPNPVGGGGGNGGGGGTPTAAATPTFDPAPGTYDSDISVALASTTSGATIHYTTDGSTPTTASPVYGAPIPVGDTDGTVTIRAIAVASGFSESAVAEGTFTVDSQLVVTTEDPTGPGSLTEALSQVTGGQTITFAGDYTIAAPADLSTESWYTIDAAVTIDGSGRTVTIDAAGLARHFRVVSPGSLELVNVTLTGGSVMEPPPTGPIEATSVTPSGKGGAILVDADAGLSLRGVTISDNEAEGDGGGVHADGDVTVIESTFLRNVSGGTGGGLSIDGDSVNLRIGRSAFLGNSASAEGGGLTVRTFGDTAVHSSIFVGNVSSDDNGGAIRIEWGSSAKITHVTFAHNEDSAGQEVSLGSSTHEVSNSLLVDDAFFAFPTVRFTSVPGGYSGNGNIDEDPLLVRPPDAGSDGEWGTPDDDYGDLSLQDASPVIDRGEASLVDLDVMDLDGDDDTAEALPVDFSGAARAVGFAPDMGAYEDQDPPAPGAPMPLPTFSPPGGTFDDDVSVTISSSESGAEIYYTLDGSEPTVLSTPYTGPITFNGNGAGGTIRAIATAPRRPTSEIAEATYAVDYPDQVSTSAPTGVGSIGQLVNGATAGDTITFAGDFTIQAPDDGFTFQSWFSLTEDLTIDGGTNDIVLDARSLTRHFFVNGATLTLRNITLINGRGEAGNGQPDRGGAIFVSPQLGTPGLVLENVTIRNSDVSGSAGHRAGGAVAIFGGALEVRDSTFIDNVAGARGGAVYASVDSALIEGSRFQGNTAPDAGHLANGLGGGAIFAQSGTPITIRDSQFTANSAPGSVSSGWGGAVYAVGNATIVGSTFTRNSASAGGGAIAVDDSSTTRVYQSQIRGGATDGRGGGIYNEGDLLVASTAFIANEAAVGGAVATDTTSASATLLSNVSFVSNTQSSGASVELATGSAEVNNSIFVGDDVASRATVFNSVSASPLPGGSGNGNVEADPLIESGPSPGSDGEYNGVGDSYGTIALQAGSPAIDAGDSARIVADAADVDGDGDTAEPLPVDLDGATRIDGSDVDAGAVERESGALAAAAAPTFNIAGGTYASTITLNLSSTTPSAEIRYTTNGGTPTSASTLYSGTIFLDTPGTYTVRAITIADGYSDSPVAEQSYTIETPEIGDLVFSPAGGVYTSPVDVEISSPVVGVTIYYTLDGTPPDVTSFEYTGPITIDPSQDITLKAIGYKSGYTPSNVGEELYRDGTITVTTDSSTGPGSLAEAIAGASTGDTITFDGDYTITAPGSLPDYPTWFIIDGKDLTIDGGSNTVILDADARGRHFAVRDGVTLTLRNLVLEDGRGERADGAVPAGAVYINDGGTLELENVFFFDNVVPNVVRTSTAGAIYVSNNAVLSIVDSAFVGNSASGNGGAIFATGSASVSSQGSRFIGNSAGGTGGAIHHDGSNGSLTLFQTEFLGNTATDDGGAVYAAMSGTASISYISDGLFVGNRSTGGLGGALVVGAGIAYSQVVNSSFAANEQASESELHHANGAGTVDNSLFVGDDTISGSAVTRYSIRDGGFSGTGNVDADPGVIFVPGPGFDGSWGTEDDDYGDVRLDSGSAAIDAGDASLRLGPFTALGVAAEFSAPDAVDLDGNTREQGTAIDLGAYERE